MASKEVVLTYEGVKKTEEELAYLKSTKRREVADRIKQALSFGDISENSEYDEAKNEQAQIEAKIIQLETLLKNAVVIDEEEVTTEKVTIGTKAVIKFMDTKEQVEYQIVGSTEANPLKGKLSNESPIGQAIIGKKVGDKAVAHTPAGDLKITIVSIDK